MTTPTTSPETTTAAPAVAIAAPGIPVGIPLDAPIVRSNGQTITHVQVRKPHAGALRGLSLVEVLQMNVTALQVLLPRVTEPTLLRQEVDAMDPADLVALGSEVVGFLVPKAQREGFQAT